MHNRFKKTALTSVLSAFSLVLLLISQFTPAARYGFAVLAGLPVFFTALSIGCQYGFLCLTITSLVGILVFPGKATVLCFICLFGTYPLIQVLLETGFSERNLLKFFFKILYSQTACFVLYLFSSLFLSADILSYAWYLLLGAWVAYVLLFFIYDKLLITLGGYFLRRFRSIIHKFIQ